MQADPPGNANVFVTLPAVQFWQAVCESSENVPATQGVHVDPPDDDSVFVTLPAVQF